MPRLCEHCGQSLADAGQSGLYCETPGCPGGWGGVVDLGDLNVAPAPPEAVNHETVDVTWKVGYGQIWEDALGRQWLLCGNTGNGEVVLERVVVTTVRPVELVKAWELVTTPDPVPPGGYHPHPRSDDA